MKMIAVSSVTYCLILLSIAVSGVRPSVAHAEISGEAITSAMARPREVLPFRGRIISFPDPRPPKDASAAEKATAQEGKRQQVFAELEEAASQGFNAVIWLGTSELFTGPHALIRLDEFPEARELTPEDNELSIDLMRACFARAKELGMDNLVYTLSIFYTSAFAEAHGLDKPMPVSMAAHTSHSHTPTCGIRNELTRAYTESVFAEFLATYEDLDGFYSPIGEAVPGHRASWFKQAIVPGLNRSGRKPLIIAHQWEIPLEDYMSEVRPESVYDNTWLGFHAYNSEQITGPKPYLSLVRWSETVGLPTVAAVYPANIQNFPFNSPRLAYEIVQEMKWIDNFVGYAYWPLAIPKLSNLFRGAMARYAASDEPYSEEPWLDILEQQYGDREAAEHFLKAFDLSARIIPEFYALVYTGNDAWPRELRVPYEYMCSDWMPFSWTTDRSRGQPLIPVHQYARFVAKHPNEPKPDQFSYRNNNGSDPQKMDYRQMAIWRTEGGSEFDIIPPVQMKKVRDMGEQCLAEAEAALATVKTNRDEAQRVRDFMEAYRLMSAYYERKVATAVAAMVYAETRDPAHKAEAEALADETLSAYLEVATFMQERLGGQVASVYGKSFHQQGKTFDVLIEEEKADRQKLGEVFGW